MVENFSVAYYLRHCLIFFDVIRMDKEQKETILSTYYYNDKNPGAFRGPRKLFLVLQKKYPGVFTLPFIRKWLNDQDSYSLLKEPRHRFKTAKVLVTSIDEQFDADLTSVENLKKYNDGVRFLLFIIDIFSRYLWVKPLHDKTAKSVLNAIKAVFSERKPLKLRTDGGSEFNNRYVKKYLKDNGIYYFTAQNTPKANYVERVQKTMKVMMYRMMRKNRSYRYLDQLQSLVHAYNSSSHSSLGIAPKDVNKHNEADIFAYMYLRKPRKPRKKIQFRFKKGDLVRISHLKHPFRRSYQQQYTSEVFKISNRQIKNGIPMYSLKDLNNQTISSALFYSSELQKVNKDEHSRWFIQDILKKRKRNGKLEYFVSWEGFPKSFNSWVSSDEVKET